MGAVPMVTMAQKRRELAHHAHSRGSHAFTHTLTSTQSQQRGCDCVDVSVCVNAWIARIHSHTNINTVTTTLLCEAPAQLLQNLRSNYYFEGTWGRGSKPEYPEKTPDILPVNRYHISEETIQRPDWTFTLQHWWFAHLANRSMTSIWKNKKP